MFKILYCVSSAAWSKCLQRLLQQPACSQSPAGPEKTGQACAGLPAALSRVPLQQETGPLEFPGYPTFTASEVPSPASRNPQTHTLWSPRWSQPGKSCRLSPVKRFFIRVFLKIIHLWVLFCDYYEVVLRTSPLVTQIAIIQEVLSDINIRKGESECQYYIDKLEYLYDKQRDPLIDKCKNLLCHGELRTKSGSVRIYTNPI